MTNINQQRHLDEWIQLWHSFEVLYYRFLRKHDISLNTFHILTALVKSPDGLEPAVIAERLGILRQALTPLLNTLEKRGFIDRQGQRGDHRRKRIVVTAAGTAFARQVEGELSELEMAAFATIPEPELNRMFHSMSLFHQKLAELTARFPTREE